MRPALRALLFSGGAFNPLDLFAGGYTGFYFDFSKTDRTFQESIGPTPADDATEPVGLALSERLWGGKTFAEVMAAQPELVTNGGFSADTNWTKGTGWTIASGVATHAAGTGSDIEQAGLISINKWYSINVEIKAVRASSLLYVWDGVAYVEILSTLSVGTHTKYFQAKANHALRVRLGYAADADIDNVSLKEIPGNHAIQSVATGNRPTRQAGGVLRFDGVDDYLLTSTLPSAAMSLFLKGTVASANKILIGSRTGTGDDFEIFTTGAGFLAVNAAAVAATSANDIRNVPGIYGATVDASFARAWIGATKAAESAMSGAINTTVPFMIGARNTIGTGSVFADLDIAYALGINRAFSPSEIAKLVNSWS